MPRRKATKNFSDDVARAIIELGVVMESPGGKFTESLGLKEASLRRWFGESEEKVKRVV